MVWKLGDLCLKCIQENVASYPNLVSNLPNLYKEILVERLACHDKFFPDKLSHISNSLFTSSLRHINLQRCDQVTDSVLKLIGISGCQLEFVELNQCYAVTDVGIQALVTDQQELQVLLLKKLPITENVLKSIKSPKLWSFTLTQHGLSKQSLLSEAVVSSFCENNRFIRRLKLNSTNNHLEVIARGLNSSLEELDLNYQTANDKGIEVLAQNCPNLRKLDLNGARFIGKEAVIMLFQACTQIEELDLSYCSNLGSPLQQEVFWTLPQSLKDLSLVGLNLANEDIFVECITRLPHITNLKLCGVSALNDSTIQRIVEKIGPQLLYLNLSGVRASEVTDEGLGWVTQHCTHLEALHISLLRQVTGNTLVPIFNDMTRAARIKKLSVNSKMMEESVLYLIVSKCPNIEFLDFSGLSIVSDGLIRSLADHAPRLNHLGLKGCKLLTDRSICYLSARCPLKHVVLSGVHALTDKSIFCIASSCPELEEIYLNACAKVSPAALRYLEDQCVGRLCFQHATPNASPNQIMGKNIDTGEYCRLDLL